MTTQEKLEEIERVQRKLQRLEKSPVARNTMLAAATTAYLAELLSELNNNE